MSWLVGFPPLDVQCIAITIGRLDQRGNSGIVVIGGGHRLRVPLDFLARPHGQIAQQNRFGQLFCLQGPA